MCIWIVQHFFSFFWMMAQVLRLCITVKFSLLEMLQSGEIDTNILLTKNLLIHLPEYTLIKISPHWSFRSILWKRGHIVRKTLKLIGITVVISKGRFTKSLRLEINLWAILAQRLALSSHFASTTKLWLSSRCPPWCFIRKVNSFKSFVSVVCSYRQNSTLSWLSEELVSCWMNPQESEDFSVTVRFKVIQLTFLLCAYPWLKTVLPKHD